MSLIARDSVTYVYHVVRPQFHLSTLESDPARISTGRSWIAVLSMSVHIMQLVDEHGYPFTFLFFEFHHNYRGLSSNDGRSAARRLDLWSARSTTRATRNFECRIPSCRITSSGFSNSINQAVERVRLVRMELVLRRHPYSRRAESTPRPRR